MRMPILRTGNYDSDRKAWLEALLEAENPSTKVSKSAADVYSAGAPSRSGSYHARRRGR